MRRWMAAACTVSLCATPAVGQALVSGTPIGVDLVIDEALSSRTSMIGDHFRLHLATPALDAAGRMLIPAGIVGEGEVIHAAKAGGAGRAGEMIVAARFLQCGTLRIRLGHTRLGVRGRDGSTAAGAANAAAAGAAVLAPLAGAGALLAFAIKGGEVIVPAGTPAAARITDEAALAGAATACAQQVQHKEGS